MSKLGFTKEHEWVRIDDEIATLGITKYAERQLGDVVYIELPEIGSNFAAGDEAAVIESVKAASELYAPVAGEVVEVNHALENDPAEVNRDPQGDGWFIKLKLAGDAALDGLMDAQAYQSFIREED
ncbi:MAG: glycine cleavage system protein GcvH [Hyphomicrobiales bacterium]